jgi:hypothetical protein
MIHAHLAMRELYPPWPWARSRVSAAQGYACRNDHRAEVPNRAHFRCLGKLL